MKSAISLIAVAHAAVALASFVAVRGMITTLDELARQGGGIATFSEGMVNAVRWPVVATWIAVGLSVLALIVARRNAAEERPMRGAAFAAIAIGGGLAGVFVFLEAAMLLHRAIVPPGVPFTEVAGRLTSASWITALCFVAAVAVALLSLRARVPMRVAVAAVLISLGVSAMAIVTLGEISAIHEDVMKGDLTRFRAELR
ncbi:MAG TPA: hypothetical protein VNI54_01810 [Thermoanaerobaculia bacterium]|nr:hypothetical protein [Thermoanaerobaculia bacterium]